MTLLELSQLMKALEFATRKNVALDPFISNTHGFYLMLNPDTVVVAFSPNSRRDFIYDRVCEWFFWGEE